MGCYFGAFIVVSILEVVPINIYTYIYLLYFIFFTIIIILRFIFYLHRGRDGDTLIASATMNIILVIVINYIQNNNFYLKKMLSIGTGRVLADFLRFTHLLLLYFDCCLQYFMIRILN